MKITQTPMLEYDRRPTSLATGQTKLKDFQADYLGGSFSVDTTFPETPDHAVRHYTFKWKFDRDARVIEAGGAIGVTFSIEGHNYGDNWAPRIIFSSTGYATNGELLVMGLGDYMLWGKGARDNERSRTLFKTVFKLTNGPKQDNAGGFQIAAMPDGDGLYLLTVNYLYEGQEGNEPPPPSTAQTPPPPTSQPPTSQPSTSQPASSHPPTSQPASSQPPSSSLPSSQNSNLPSGPDLSGNWIHTQTPGKPDAHTRIVGNGSQFTIVNEFNDSFSAIWENANTFWIKDVAGLPGGLRGTVSSDGNRIDWSNQTVWQRASASGQPVVSKMSLKTDVWTAKPGDTITVPVWLLKGQGLVDMNFDLTYDASVAIAGGAVDRGNLLSGGDFEGNAGKAGTVKVGFVPTSGGINAPDGTVARITFKVVGQPGTRTPLTLVARKSSIAGGAAADVAVINGEIDIVGKDALKPGDVDGDGELTIKDVLLALKMSVDLLPKDPRANMDDDPDITAKDARLIREAVERGGNR